jgi:drug/metabolite transporter (DMT)-like permease
VIGFLTPPLTAYATSMVLHTTFSSSQIVASITAFLGVVIIADPFSLYQSGVAMLPGDSSDSIPSQLILENLSSVSFHRNLSIAIGLFSALVTACGFTTIRLVGDRAHVLIQVNYYSMVSTIISGLALVLPMPPFPFLGDTGFCFPATLREWILLAYIGVSGFMLQVLMTAGLQADSSSRATNMMYSQIIFALCLDWGIWGRIPGWGSAFGGAVVIGAVIWSSLGKPEVIPKKVNHDAYTAIEMDEDEIGFHDEDSIRREQV